MAQSRNEDTDVSTTLSGATPTEIQILQPNQESQGNTKDGTVLEWIFYNKLLTGLSIRGHPGFTF
jgi:hypothetical protein